MNLYELKPSELIRVALKDLAEVEKDPMYVVNMSYWHGEHYGWDEEDGFVPSGKCMVCLAGAVMAKSLGAAFAEESNPALFWEDEGALRALDDFRLGGIEYGLQELGIPREERHFACTDWDVADYANDPQQFHRDMEDMAAHLEEQGL